MKGTKKPAKADEEGDVLAKIAEMQDSDHVMAERLHAVIKASAPDAKDGKVVRFFRGAEKFKTRYATFGFSGKANLDERAIWPNSYALTKLTAADEARIAALVKQAVS